MSRCFLARGGRLEGRVQVPGDKSISHRALMLAGLADGASRIRHFLAGEDCLATLGAMRALGVRLEQPQPTEVRVQGVGLHGLRAPAMSLDMGNAGTAMRLFAGLLAGQSFSSRLIGDESLMRRPMERVAVPLRAMGARIRTHEGRPPLEITGAALHGISYAMPMASAQVKSAVLLAGLYAQGATRVMAPAPSRDHSERMLEQCGVPVRTEGLTTTLEPVARLEPLDLEVPGDFSSAAFFIVGALIGGGPKKLRLEKVGINPTRTGLLTILRRMGASIELESDSGTQRGEPVATLCIEPGALQGTVVPPELVPLAIDEFPALFIAAACASGTTVVSGAEELRVKESDRIATMAAGLAALGVEHQVRPDGIEIEGRASTAAAFRGGEVDSHGDHRVAMAFAIASLRASGAIRIRDVANVATSFPGFVALGRQLGLDVADEA